MCVDDTVLLAHLASGLQHLLKNCETFAIDCDMVYNSKKRVYMWMQPKGLDIISIPKMCLNGKYIKLVSEHKY